MGFGMFTTSCEDMLTPDSERHSYTVASDTLYSYWGILKSLQNIAERYVILGECRADLVSGTGYVSDTISAIMNFGQNGTADEYKDGECAYLKVSDYYHVINSCNAYIANCDTMRRTGTNEKYMIKEYAQVTAIRAWTYMQLVLAYGEVPFYTKPLLTTADITDFVKDPNSPKVNADNLVDELGPELKNMEYVEKVYGFPQYNSYGRTTAVCHSSKCMFPVSLVLGDLYLLKGDAASCAEAAQHYYNFLNSENGGPLNPSYASQGDLTERSELPEYSFATSSFYNSTGEVSATSEMITCIPSSTNRLWGTVNTGINRLFGFDATIRVQTFQVDNPDNDDASTSTVSSISLSRNDERELVASNGYKNLCQLNDYEIYISPDEAHAGDTIYTMPKVGDARQAWNMRTYYYDNNRRDTLYYVYKQNPSGGYSTTYPVIYRKATVWLRYAEAINRAGFHSYAFAVLQNGLCNNDNWFPQPEDYDEVKTAVWSYTRVVDEETEEVVTNGTRQTPKEFAAYLIATLPEGETVDLTKITYTDAEFYNYPNASTPAICYYIDKKELDKAVGLDYMNFATRYLRSQFTSAWYIYKNDLRDNGMMMSSYPSIAENYITMGVHTRGGGQLKYDERKSRYNYVDKVIERAKKNYGVTLTKEDIYSGEQDDVVTKAVEDLIVEEMGLETAFEGNRFFDLMRIAHRRGDASYLADRVASRSGNLNPTMREFLMNSNNWYLPFPVDKW